MIYWFVFSLLLAPLYIWRFSIAGLPVNFLMVFLAVLIGIGFWVIIRDDTFRLYWDKLVRLPLLLKVGVGLFVLASIVSLFVGGFDQAKLGQWIVLIVQPILVASLLYFFATEEGHRDKIVEAAFWFVGITGAIALLQYFFLLWLPPDWWGNPDEPKRAISVFIHPNNYALFIAPLIVYLLPTLRTMFGRAKASPWSLSSINLVLWTLGLLGLLVSMSRGGWLAVLAATGIFVVFKASKKIVLSFVVLLVLLSVVFMSVPNLRYRILLPFQGEKSSVARFSLWDTGQKMIADSPILGQGINGFNYGWEQYNTDPNLDHYNFPHNIILNFWVDYGLLGLVGFLLILTWLLYYGFRNRGSPYALGILLVAVAVVVHGMVDIPYLKNDLALVFWLLVATSLEGKYLAKV